MVLYAVDVDWKTIITAGSGAVILLLGALSKNFNDIVKNWFSAKAQAKLDEAKAATTEKDAAFARMTTVCDRLERELEKTKQHIARQDTYADALTDALLEVRQEHAVCLAENRDMRAFWEANKARLESAGITLLPLPSSREPTDEQRKDREFKLRQLEQARRALKAVGEDLLQNGAYPTPQPSTPATPPRP